MLRLLCLAAVPLLATDADLLSAARRGDLAAVKAQLEMGAALEAKTPYGQTPLYLAAMQGHEPVVEFLLSKGASTNVRDTFYKAPMLVFTLQRKHFGVAKLLIAKGSGSPDEALAAVAPAGNAELVEAALSRKPSQAAIDKAYESALDQKQTAAAEALKRAGANEPAPPVTVAPKILATYEGSYKSAAMPLEIKAFVKDGRLYVQATGQPEFALKPKSQTLFELQQARLEIEFHEPGSFTLRQGGQTFLFKKAVTQ